MSIINKRSFKTNNLQAKQISKRAPLVMRIT